MPLKASSHLPVFILELTQQAVFNSNASVRQIFVNFRTFSCSQEIHSCHRSHEGRVYSVVGTRNEYIRKYVMNSGKPLEESYRVILYVYLLFPRVQPQLTTHIEFIHPVSLLGYVSQAVFYIPH